MNIAELIEYILQGQEPPKLHDEDQVPDKYQNVPSTNADYFVQEEEQHLRQLSPGIPAEGPGAFLAPEAGNHR